MPPRRARPRTGKSRHSRRTNASTRRRNAPSAVRSSTISTLPSMVREAAPTGKAVSDRSCGQPALIVASAAGPVTEIATLRCEMPTAECKRVDPGAIGERILARLVETRAIRPGRATAPCARPSTPKLFGFLRQFTPSAFDSAAIDTAARATRCARPAAAPPASRLGRRSPPPGRDRVGAAAAVVAHLSH